MVLHGTPWRYMYFHCHQMVTKAEPKVSRGCQSVFNSTYTDEFQRKQQFCVFHMSHSGTRRA